MLLEIHWDPDRNFFLIPYLNHPVTWYGALFAIGFLVGFFLVKQIFTRFVRTDGKTEEEAVHQATFLTDRLTLLVGLGAIIGARLGHVFFYDWSYYKHNLFDILKIWEGGLSSHGGAVGVLIALSLFLILSRHQKPKFTFLTLLDAIVIPAAFAGGCIRIGNFINQEITGTPTNLPWGVAFGHPLDGVPGLPVHPVQIYESLFYFFIFILLYGLWRRKTVDLGSGFLSGLFFFLLFGFRFFIEFLKTPQNLHFDTTGSLTMGQWLSFPFILLGALLLVRYYVRKKR